MSSPVSRVLLGLSVLLVALVVLVGYSVATSDRVRHREGWREAGVERNVLDLALDRARVNGHDISGDELARSVRHGTVLASGGTARLRHGDLYVVVRYRLVYGGGGLQPSTTSVECWRFTAADEFDVNFEYVGCP